MKKLRIFGIILWFISMGLTWYLFSWKLVLVLILMLWANNLEQRTIK